MRKLTYFLTNVRTSAAVCKLNFACCPALLPCCPAALPCSAALLPCSVALPCPALLPCAAACCFPLLPCAAALHARLSHCMSLGTRDTCTRTSQTQYSIAATIQTNNLSNKHKLSDKLLQENVQVPSMITHADTQPEKIKKGCRDMLTL